MARMKKWIPKAHWEPARDWQQLLTYCHKAETRVNGPATWGKEKTQGERSDLASTVDMVKAGRSMKEIAESNPCELVKYYKGLIYLQQLLTEQGDGAKKVGLFWGITGSGKTRLAFEELEDLYSTFDVKTPWFDGYNKHKNVLMDECGMGMMNYNFLKRILDRYPMQVPIKGGSVWWQPTTIIMTSNIPLDEWYPLIPKADLDAIKRRIRIFEFPQDAQLAQAWLRGTLIEKRPRPEPVPDEARSDNDDFIRLLHYN